MIFENKNIIVIKPNYNEIIRNDPGELALLDELEALWRTHESLVNDFSYLPIHKNNYKAWLDKSPLLQEMVKSFLEADPTLEIFIHFHW